MVEIKLPRLVGSREAALRLLEKVPESLTNQVVMVNGRECASVSDTVIETLVYECMMKRDATLVVSRGLSYEAQAKLEHEAWRWVVEMGDTI